MELTIEQALHKGAAAHNAGNLQEAARVYQAILQSQPRHPEANHHLGLIAISLNQVAAALPLFETAVEVNPMKEQFWLSYIDALVKNNQLKNAKQAINNAGKKGFDTKKFDALLAQPAVTVDSKAPSQQQLGILLEHYQSGRLDEAENLATTITQEFPTYQFGWKVLGAVLKQAGKNAEAADAQQTAVSLLPEDAEAHSNLGVTLQELGRLVAAEASCRHAIGLQPDYAEAHYNLGITLKELGRLAEAEACYTKAIALMPDFAQAHYNLGMTLQELGRMDEAEASYTQAIALIPAFADALRNRSILLFNKKEFEAALKDADLIISKGAREFDLTTLYALGRTEEIYKRLETRSEVDGENISIAAFAAFIAEAEKRSTAYNFCPNPLDFIHSTNLASHVEDSGAFASGLIDELEKIETVWQPSEKTTVGGFQTPNGMNLFNSPNGKIAELKSIIIAELEAYKCKFRDASCAYIQKWPSGNNLFGWHVILKQQGHQKAHIHNGGWLSGVIYLKVVPSLGNNEGAIEFSLNGEHYHDANSPGLTFQPEAGDIIFFPSSLHHRTIPFTTDSNRIIVSFDLMPNAAKNQDTRSALKQ